MNERKREYFDRQVEWVLSRLPQGVLHILESVPLHVEDRPSKSLMRKVQIKDATKICSYLCGAPCGKTSKHFGTHVYLPKGICEPNSVTIFRRGIVAASRDEEGQVRRDSIRQQIRTSILCALARLLGMGEKEIADIRCGFT